MRERYTRAMDLVYWACVTLSIASIVMMTILVFVGVTMRYVFGIGAQFSEPLSIYFAIQMTFYGGAACFRDGKHLRLEFFHNLLPDWGKVLADWAIVLLILALGTFMVVYGVSLVDTTWFQSYPEFEWVRVGWVYTAIPGGGFVMALFVIERALYGATPRTLAARAAEAE